MTKADQILEDIKNAKIALVHVQKLQSFENFNKSRLIKNLSEQIAHLEHKYETEY